MDRLIVSRRASAHVVPLLLAGAVLSLPPIGLANNSGGAGLGGSGGGPSGSSDRMGQVQPGNSKVSASGGGITITTRESGFLQRQMTFAGSVPSSAAHERVEVERWGKQTGWTWSPTAHGYAHRNGSFTIAWTANHIGRFRFRAVLAPGRGGRVAGASPSVTATVFRYSIATEYGPGFWGSKTACGETLHQNTLGTANRTLPCGTHVEIYYHGRTLIVPVIDRGPYANHADWDLTEATDRALRIPGTATIGAVSLPSHH
jgi:rare lipoprotein A